MDQKENGTAEDWDGTDSWEGVHWLEDEIVQQLRLAKCGSTQGEQEQTRNEERNNKFTQGSPRDKLIALRYRRGGLRNHQV